MEKQSIVGLVIFSVIYEIIALSRTSLQESFQLGFLAYAGRIGTGHSLCLD